MPRTSTKPKTVPSCPEFAVRRETISRFFDPPLARSTFYDLVNHGRIVPVKEIRGFYRLNESLRRLGLREVPELPGVEGRTTEDILRLAFTLIDPLLFPPPAWMLDEDLEARDADHARVLAAAHRREVEERASEVGKLHYFSGVLDAQKVMEREPHR